MSDKTEDNRKVVVFGNFGSNENSSRAKTTYFGDATQAVTVEKEYFGDFAASKPESTYYSPDGSVLAVEERDYDMLILKTKREKGGHTKENWYGTDRDSVDELMKRIEKRFSGDEGGFVRIYKVKTQSESDVVNDLVEDIENGSDEDESVGHKTTIIGNITLNKWRDKSENACGCAKPNLKYKLPPDPYKRIGVARVESVADINNWYCHNKNCDRKFVQLGATKFDQSEKEAKAVARRNRRFIKSRT